jgi:hypothetical protein
MSFKYFDWIGSREAEHYEAKGKEVQDEKKAKRDLQDLIQKQFSLRRKSSCQENEGTSAKYSRVRAADVTGVKVNGLTISVCLTKNPHPSIISYNY